MFIHQNRTVNQRKLQTPEWIGFDLTLQCLSLSETLIAKNIFKPYILSIPLHIHTHTQDILGKITKYFNIANFYILWPITICSYFVLFCKYTKKYAYVVYISKNSYHQYWYICVLKNTTPCLTTAQAHTSASIKRIHFFSLLT